ncbi:MAG: hypothetical protein A3F31_05620 [Candidatus Levybacteria bacterium RIFCSPHIGHO2_12_FULL_38_12]|nr:MAG: hypothetical protein A2770_04795 [Candidatus Levybacteria bacterium RIFCSPHIGHO2_01_FULL_38_12]OGH21574.1 MAG: hypothetical protein A3D75_02420 [Candidatus Levybacteria bacterium RIFCSPHIGHO2_02_FULL_37_18]OGH23095.1 MAG: hypothetical protein A3F31_05620 [Candidatus Levybacteria bacterium RIFCSPHIGHO2_12_FULL_38_12]OGH34739.1 MAG: hypothetical protein A3A47_01100 [Candidatus Levybacteria bacterium RIFCSPLOWO2_01_FULL_37_20]OGH43586.1 MAG: hypothetical protein A3J14_03335 [Candidatus Lev
MAVLIALFFAFVIFLFTLFILSREDFVFTRKNIPMEEIYNICFLLIPFIFFFSRLLFVVFDFNAAFSNPLVFLAIWHYPGLSLLGAVAGLITGLLLICGVKKISVIDRILDIFSLSFFGAISFGVRVGSLIFSFGTWFVFGKELVFTILFILMFFLLLHFFLKEKFKDGSILLLFVLAFSVLTFLSKTIGNPKYLFTLLKGEGSILVIAAVASSILFIKREKLQFKFTNIFKKR